MRPAHENQIKPSDLAVLILLLHCVFVTLNHCKFRSFSLDSVWLYFVTGYGTSKSPSCQPLLYIIMTPPALTLCISICHSVTDTVVSERMQIMQPLFGPCQSSFDVDIFRPLKWYLIGWLIGSWQDVGILCTHRETSTSYGLQNDLNTTEWTDWNGHVSAEQSQKHCTVGV